MSYNPGPHNDEERTLHPDIEYSQGPKRKRRRLAGVEESINQSTRAESDPVSQSHRNEEDSLIADQSAALSLRKSSITLRPERPTTPPHILNDQDPEVTISPHTSRWLDAQMIDNPISLGLVAWENLQSMGKAGEAEEHTRMMIDEEDEENQHHQADEEETTEEPVHISEDLRYLVSNGRFVCEETLDAPDIPATTTATGPRVSENADEAAAVQAIQAQGEGEVNNLLSSRLRLTRHGTSMSSVSDSDDTEDSLINQASYNDEIMGVPQHRSKYEISKFVLGIAIWCEAKGITRSDYASLREVLCMKGDTDFDELPEKLGTLLSWCRRRLPLPPLQKSKIPIKPEKQPSNTSGATADMYFFDPRYLVAMLLSTTSSSIDGQMYFGMAEIVDSPTHLWQSHCWGSSIRTCSHDFARYQDESPIIPSDFVRFSGMNFGRVVFFGRDCRDSSPTRGKVLLRIQRVVMKATLDQSRSIDMVLIEDDIIELQPTEVSYIDYIAIQRSFEEPLSTTSAPVTQVYNSRLSQFRSTDKLKAIKGELEIEYYGRTHLITSLLSGVISLPFTCFIDEFGLYRNMYRAMCGIYLTVSSISLQERQRTRNVFPITLGPHGSVLNDVIKALEEGFKALEKGCQLRIRDQVKTVWAPILAFTGDMKSQQEAAGFLGPTANLSCRMCYANQDTRDDMELDTCIHGRYHHETLYQRYLGTQMTKTNRVQHYRQLGLALEPSALQAMTPALDLIISRPGDPAHSEFYGIVRRIMPVLCKDILTAKAVEQFTVQFRSFPFPPGWGRIQSPATHMKSWTMSECARASVIVPLLLRCWPLCENHIRPNFVIHLMRQTICTRERKASEWIIFFLGQLAKSNSLVASTSLSIQDRASLLSTVLNARRGFQAMMNAAASITSKKTKKTKSTQSRTRQPSVSGTETQMSMAPSVFTSRTLASTEQAPTSTDPDDIKMAALPNVHAALHFDALMSEYGLLWNVNALPGERKHKFFKAMVLSTNHRKVERQLLVKSCVQNTIRLALEGAFTTTDPTLTEALQSLQQKCPKLFQDLIPEPGQVDLNEQYHQYIGDSSHIGPLVHGKASTNSIRYLGLPRKMSQVSTSGEFFTELRAAFLYYGHTSLSLGSKSIHWYNQLSFQDPLFSYRSSFKCGDFIHMNSVRFLRQPLAQIQQIFSHAFDRDTERRIFLQVQRLQPANDCDQDTVLKLPMLEFTGERPTIALLEVSGKRVWMVPVKRTNTENNGTTWIHCNWDVQFS